jgi:hypothetical protein
MKHIQNWETFNEGIFSTLTSVAKPTTLFARLKNNIFHFLFKPIYMLLDYFFLLGDVDKQWVGLKYYFDTFYSLSNLTLDDLEDTPFTEEEKEKILQKLKIRSLMDFDEFKIKLKKELKKRIKPDNSDDIHELIDKIDNYNTDDVPLNMDVLKNILK